MFYTLILSFKSDIVNIEVITVIYDGKNLYTEKEEISLKHKKAYLDSVYKFIQNGQASARNERDRYIDPQKLSENPDFYRSQFMSVVGIPDFDRSETPDFKREFVGRDDMCEIYRISVEVLPDFWFYGVLMLPENAKGPLPLVIAQHGGGGTPEYCSDMYGENNYSNFTRRALAQGFAVFAPCLLLWSFDINTGEKFPKFDLPFNRMQIDRELSKLGTSIIGLEIFCIMRCIDLLSTFEQIDGGKIGMMGLSYGGFFSLYTAAADTRIKSIYSAAAFNDRDRVFLGDFVWRGQSAKFHDAEVAGLCCPRSLIIDVGKSDPVFDGSFASDEAARAERYYKYQSAEHKFTFNLWDGGHKFDTESGNFDRFFEEIKK